MIPNHIDVISMGCSKNLIDSERLLRLILFYLRLCLFRL